MEAKRTPLIDLLETIPADARLVVEDDPYSTSFYPVGRLCHEAAAALRERLAQPDRKLWLWKNFEEGRPEYWAFDNPYPTNLDDGDPQTLGQPCGYAIFKQSRDGSCGRTEEQVLREINIAMGKAAEQ